MNAKIYTPFAIHEILSANGQNPVAILSDNPDNENSGFIIEKPCFTDPSRHYVQYLLLGRAEQ